MSPHTESLSKMQNNKRAQLLSPAGDMEKLKFAVAYGADAVYLSGQVFGMRTASGNFNREELVSAVEYCHARGVKAYVTVNTMPRNDEIACLPEYLEFLASIGTDVIIAADLGVIALAARHAPGVDIHVSTQTSIVNYHAAQAYYDMGAKRVVLARELSLAEIAEICAKRPRGLEIETFVHGSMCMSYSGRCMLSNYMAGRDANRGNCAQPCRWSYRLLEEKRPGEYFPVYEDDSGTHIFNSKDMSMINHIPQLIEAGIDSLKIEGRVKTFYYAAVITNAYRRALDAFYSGEPLTAAISDEVDKVSHRDYYTGFYFRDTNSIRQRDSEYIRNWDVCAVVEQCDPEGEAIVMQKNKFSEGDRLELLCPGRDAAAFSPEDMRDMDGKRIASAPHPHMKVRLRLPAYAPAMSVIRRQNAYANQNLS